MRGRLAVVGLGMIGGSVAWAARLRGVVREVVGVARRAEVVREALERGVVDRASTRLEEVRGAELVVLAVHLGATGQLARQLTSLVGPNGVVTDVGSVKAPVVEELEGLFGGRFVGGHPIAGTERSGLGAANPELFQGRRVVLTPTARTDPEALRRVEALWEGLGAEVVRMDPGLHDRLLASLSHLPHLVAYALVLCQLRLHGPEDVLRLSGGGLRDFTRIAASHPAMWRDICLANREEVLRSLDAFERSLAELRRAIQNADGQALRDAFALAKQLREGMR